MVKNNGYLSKHDLVHHIDGDKTNNNPNNLFVCHSKAIHQDIHTQLEELSMTLVKAGIIQFDHKIGKYHLPQLKEILAAYSANSEETYVLEINDLGNMAILSQADSGATLLLKQQPRNAHQENRKVQRLSRWGVGFKRTRSAEIPNHLESFGRNVI